MWEQRPHTPPFLRFLNCSWAFQEIPDAWLAPNLPCCTFPWPLTLLWLLVVLAAAALPTPRKSLVPGRAPMSCCCCCFHVHSPSELKQRALTSMARDCLFLLWKNTHRSPPFHGTALRVSESSLPMWDEHTDSPAHTQRHLLAFWARATLHSHILLRFWGKPSFLFLPLEQGLDWGERWL